MKMQEFRCFNQVVLLSEYLEAEDEAQESFPGLPAQLLPIIWTSLSQIPKIVLCSFF
jgi:hypothetical protein